MIELIYNLYLLQIIVQYLTFNDSLFIKCFEVLLIYNNFIISDEFSFAIHYLSV